MLFRSAIVGKSGSGKSTIANLIPRFYNHSSGDVLIDGVSVNDYSLQHLRSSISIVNQSPSLFNDTIAKNIAYGDDTIDSKKLIESAKQAGCIDFIERLPEGFESEIGDDGVLAMICDSTNVFSMGRSGSEMDVRKNMLSIIGRLKKRIIVTSFASNVARMESVFYCAEKTGRQIALVGRSMHRIFKAARECG